MIEMVCWRKRAVMFETGYLCSYYVGQTGGSPTFLAVI